jgi:hypothetical protein
MATPQERLRIMLVTCFKEIRRELAGLSALIMALPPVAGFDSQVCTDLLATGRMFGSDPVVFTGSSSLSPQPVWRVS